MASALTKLFKINSSYPPGSDNHYHFTYLAYPFVEGAPRFNLDKKKISDMKKDFEKQHGDESISLIRMLLEDCSDKKSSDSLIEGDSPSGITFAGMKVTVENREFYNFRRLIVQVVTNLLPSQVEDMVTYLQDVLKDPACVPGSHPQSLLLLFERARQQNLIGPQNVDELKKWLGVFEREDLISEVNQFEPRKQFPGSTDLVPTKSQKTVQHQCSDADTELAGQKHEGTSIVAAPDPVKRMMSAASGQGSFDSAIGEEDSRERTGSGAPDPHDSLMSYQGGTDLEARLRSGSTEERGPRERSEMVSGNTANAKSS